MTVTPELLARTAALTTEVLLPLAGADWSVPAGDLEWSCRETAVHLADDYFSYAAQVICQPSHGYGAAELVVPGDASVESLLEATTMAAEVLRLAATAADPHSRAWHPLGVSDPNGFVAMGVVEGLVHTQDIAAGLGVAWQPPADLCAAVLGRLFPDAPAGDPVDVLLWCTGRAPLGELERLQRWRWWAAVPG
jgi:hypothetical protein